MTELVEDRVLALKSINKKMVLMVGSPACPYCLAIKPFFQTISSVYKEVKFYYIDSSKLNQETRTFLELSGVPLLLSFSEGTIIERKTGGNVDNVLDVLNKFINYNDKLTQ